MRQSLLLSAFYISLGVAFGGFIWWNLGLSEPGSQNLTGFVVEKSLAMDNIFVIAMIFGVLRHPEAVPAPGAGLRQSLVSSSFAAS